MRLEKRNIIYKNKFLHDYTYIETIGGTSRATFEIPAGWLNVTIYILFCAKDGFEKCYNSDDFVSAVTIHKLSVI